MHIVEPTVTDLQRENDELIKQIKGLHTDLQVFKARLDEAITELSRWKIEALERRKQMIGAQKETLYRVPIVGVVK